MLDASERDAWLPDNNVVGLLELNGRDRAGLGVPRQAGLVEGPHSDSVAIAGRVVARYLPLAA